MSTTDPITRPETAAIPHRQRKAVYDFIVVGAGSGGAAVTRRLVDAGADVLLIEAGPPGIGIAEIDDPSKWVSLGRSAYDWGYDYAPTSHVDGRIIGIPRGKVLGGSSAINAMMWYRGHPADYDAWDASGAKGWAFKDVLPYFRRCEDWEGGMSEWRGAGGPLRIERSRALHPIATALIEGAAELGIPVIDDPNGATNEGAAPSNFNISDGKRFSSARGYLWPVLERDNLTVLPNSLATGLGFEGRRCVSVRHLVDGEEVETRAAVEIILALGAIDTPRLLMLSGIGAPAELTRLGIAVRTALAGVGQNLQDHPLVRAVNFRAKRPLGPVSDNGGGSMVNWKTRSSLAQPNVHAFPVQGRSATTEVADGYDLNGNVFAIGTGLMRSRSRGYLRLLGKEPGSPIEIQPNFLSDARGCQRSRRSGRRCDGAGDQPGLCRLVRRLRGARKEAQSQRDRKLHPHRVLDLLSCLRHGQNGQRQHVCGRRAAGRARRRWSAYRGRFRDSDHSELQHPRARHHDRRAGGGFHSAFHY